MIYIFKVYYDLSSYIFIFKYGLLFRYNPVKYGANYIKFECLI